MALFGEIVAAARAWLRRAAFVCSFAVRELWALCAAWIKETAIILTCLASLYLARMAWDVARAALPLWQQGTVGAICRSLLAAMVLLLEGGLTLVCGALVQCMIFVLLIQGSRVPLHVLSSFAGNRMTPKKVLVWGSAMLSCYVLALYYGADEHTYVRGVALRRSGLFDAAARNQTSRLRFELARGKHVDEDAVGWPFEYTALHEASRVGHAAVVTMLLDAGANVTRATAFGDTALHLASCNGHLEVVRLLLARGADANQGNTFGDTSLILASYHGHAKISQLLVDAGASTDAMNSYGDSALTLAVRQRHGSVVRALQASQRRPLLRRVGSAIATFSREVLAPVWRERGQRV